MHVRKWKFDGEKVNDITICRTELLQGEGAWGKPCSRKSKAE